MNLSLVFAGVLVLAVLLAWARLLAWQRRASVDSRASGWRLLALMGLQPLSTALLYLTLLPSAEPTNEASLIVATAGASLAQTGQQPGDRLVALPEAPEMAGVERVPDLGTALRRYPGTQGLRVIGAGLEARDRAAVGGLPLAFDPSPLPRGLLRLHGPTHTAPGAAFVVAGHAHLLEGGSAELIDPAGRRTDSVLLTKAGDFKLHSATRVSGEILFQVRLRDAKRNLVEDAQVPVWSVTQPAPRLLLLAGAPSPEIKYLRRWAQDAGLAMQTQIDVGGGVTLGDPPVNLNAESLRKFDVAILDERSWEALSAIQRRAIVDAMHGGLGVMLRVTGALPQSTRRQWQETGFVLAGGGESIPVQLGAESNGDESPGEIRSDVRDVPPSLPRVQSGVELTRRNVRVIAADATPLIHDDKRVALASWRAAGRGRIAMWSLTDSFKLVLSGHADRHAALWSQVLSVLARPADNAAPRIDALPRQQQRLALCGLRAGAYILAPDGSRTTLLPDKSGDDLCAAYWPQQAGWHHFEHGLGTDQEGSTQQVPGAFYVYPENALPGVHAVALRDNTARSATASPDGNSRRSNQGATMKAGSTALFFLAWLISVAALWWLERARPKARTGG